MSVSRQQVLGAYRNLLKAQKQTFKGDWATLAAAREKTYTEFNLKRNETDEAKIKEQFELATQVASLLRHNLAQAVQIEGKNDIYSLKLNENHELGDNETLRQASKLRRLKNQQAQANGQPAPSSGGCGSPSCCGGSH
ncbi:Complex III assembly factor lyrm7 [Mortierella sp. AD032]|nr:Complex III assembly factor lyrm7 [Mortierella sp. AD032]